MGCVREARGSRGSSGASSADASVGASRIGRLRACGVFLPSSSIRSTSTLSSISLSGSRAGGFLSAAPPLFFSPSPSDCGEAALSCSGVGWGSIASISVSVARSGVDCGTCVPTAAEIAATASPGASLALVRTGLTRRSAWAMRRGSRDATKRSISARAAARSAHAAAHRTSASIASKGNSGGHRTRGRVVREGQARVERVWVEGAPVGGGGGGSGPVAIGTGTATAGGAAAAVDSTSIASAGMLCTESSALARRRQGGKTWRFHIFVCVTIEIFLLFLQFFVFCPSFWC